MTTAAQPPSDTPRTDAAIAPKYVGNSSWGALEECSRQLERELAVAKALTRDTEGVLRRAGFVPCDIMACNCGSWHARYGLPERFDEIKQLLADAEHPLCNDNGNLVRNALRELIEERDQLRATIARQAEEIDRLGKDAGRWDALIELWCLGNVELRQQQNGFYRMSIEIPGEGFSVCIETTPEDAIDSYANTALAKEPK